MRASKFVRSLMRPDTAEAIAARLAARAASEQAYKETLERFGAITPENAKDAIEWQEARIAELLKA
jgi:hypothetical protein